MVVAVEGTLLNNAFIHSDRLDRYTHMMENDYIHCLDFTSVWRWRRRMPACAVDRRWQRRRRPVCARGRVSMMEEETDSSGVDGGEGDRWSRERRGHREFCDEK
jgi:hypothetical protein